jgi:hypothetical protein
LLTPEEATAALEEAHRVRRLGWRLVSGQATRLPLVWWGLAWMVTFPGAQLLPFPAALALGVAANAAAFALTSLGSRWDPAPGRTGWERTLARSWWAVLAGSLAVNLIAAPAPIPVFFLIPGAIWGLAMLLYAVAAGDRLLGVLGGGLAVLAAALRVLLLDESLLLFGLAGGGAMVAVGALRLRGSAAAP